MFSWLPGEEGGGRWQAAGRPDVVVGGRRLGQVGTRVVGRCESDFIVKSDGGKFGKAGSAAEGRMWWWGDQWFCLGLVGLGVEVSFRQLDIWNEAQINQ